MPSQFDPPKLMVAGYIAKAVNPIIKFCTVIRIIGITVRERTQGQPLGGRLKPTPKGTLIELTVGGGGVKATGPFKIIDASTEDYPARMRVIAGTLSSPLFGYAEVPSGMSPGDDPPFYLDAVGSSGYVYLVVEVTLEEGEVPVISSVTVEAGASVPSSTETIGYFSLGTYTVDSTGDFDVTKPISSSGDVGYLYCAGHYFWGTRVEV